jgi:hypothetical protein
VDSSANLCADPAWTAPVVASRPPRDSLHEALRDPSTPGFADPFARGWVRHSTAGFADPFADRSAKRSCYPSTGVGADRFPDASTGSWFGYFKRHYRNNS